MLGCDYCDTIKGIGAKRAKELIDKHRCIEKVIENLDTKKYTVPENWPYQEARRLFKTPDVTDAESLDVSLSLSNVSDHNLIALSNSLLFPVVEMDSARRRRSSQIYVWRQKLQRRAHSLWR